MIARKRGRRRDVTILIPRHHVALGEPAVGEFALFEDGSDRFDHSHGVETLVLKYRKKVGRRLESAHHVDIIRHKPGFEENLLRHEVERRAYGARIECLATQIG